VASGYHGQRVASARITVVIPTRQRHEVLEKALRTVVEQDYGDLEIIVSDNFSSDATADVVRASRDERIRYLNTGRRLSMAHNWEFALSHVKEGWVTVMGDDDGLLPGSVRRLAEIVQHDTVEAVRSAVCSYSWPSLLGRTSGGHLVVPLRRGSEQRNARRWLAKALRGTASYADLPMLYTGGYVDSRVLERIKQTTGVFYLSRIPDVYSAVAIASCVDQYLYLHEPLGINGASRHSTGTSLFETPDAQESPALLFASEPNIPFHTQFPQIPGEGSPRSFQALIYESYLQSAALRAGVPKKDLRVGQLELILAAASGADVAPVMEWGRNFAALHGIDFGTVAARAAARRRFAQPKRWLERLASYLNSYVVRNAGLPIDDVHEAAVAAAAICAARPNRLGNLAALLPRLAKEVLGR
jgi:hypothetical protein